MLKGAEISIDRIVEAVHAGSVLVIDRLGNFHCVNGSLERAREGDRGGGEKIMTKSMWCRGLCRETRGSRLEPVHALEGANV